MSVLYLGSVLEIDGLGRVDCCCWVDRRGLSRPKHCISQHVDSASQFALCCNRMYMQAAVWSCQPHARSRHSRPRGCCSGSSSSRQCQPRPQPAYRQRPAATAAAAAAATHTRRRPRVGLFGKWRHSSSWGKAAIASWCRWCCSSSSRWHELG
jgi:hypothetical protein